MTDDAELLASAYLDGEVTAEERARVESDPALSAEVERLRLARTAMAAVEPAPISRREEHLAAALAVWDEGSIETHAAAAPPAPSAVARARTWSSSRWLVAAAAALVLVVGAGVILRQTDQTGSDDSAAVEQQAPADDNAPEAAEATESDSDVPAATAVTDEEAPAEEESSDEAPADAVEESGGLAEAVEAETEPAARATVEEFQLSGSEAEDRGPPPESDQENLTLLDSSDDLADYARPAFESNATTIPPEALIESDAPAAEASSERAAVDTVLDDAADDVVEDESLAEDPDVIDLNRCGGMGVDVIVGPAIYAGTVVVVGVDRSASAAIAYDPETCAVIATAALP